MHDGLVDQMREWSEDLLHVALRIRAREEDTLDPGTLVEAQSTRQQEKAKQEKAAE
jgi:hypothetical protein